MTWRDLSRCVQDPRWGYALRERISESQEKAYPLHLASVNCRRYLPLVPRVRDIVGAHLRIRRFLFSRDPCLSICSPGFLRNSMGSRGETFEKKRMFVPLLLIFLLVLLKNEKLQNRRDLKFITEQVISLPFFQSFFNFFFFSPRKIRTCRRRREKKEERIPRRYLRYAYLSTLSNSERALRQDSKDIIEVEAMS